MGYLLLHHPVHLPPPPCWFAVYPPHHRSAAQPPHCSTASSPSSPPFRPSRITVRWEPPRAGWFKLNFDGSVYHDGSGRASIGGAIRGPDGRVVIAFAETADHWCIGVVEARALTRGLRLALAFFMERLVVEGDDLVLIQLLRGEETQTRIPAAVHDEIVTLLGCFAEVEVQHIYREGNQVADGLCRQAYRYPGVWTTAAYLSPAVAEKVDEDRRGVAHERLCKPRAGVTTA